MILTVHKRATMNTNATLIQWNFSHSCFEVLGHFDQSHKARQRMADVKRHPAYEGQDLEIISDYELGRLEALA